MAYLGAKLLSGSQAILALCGFEEQLNDTDLVITGEGRLDAQSFQGKVLSGILRSAEGVPVCSICGVCTCCGTALLREHNVDVFETSEGVSAEENMRNPEKYLRLATRKAIGYYMKKH